MLKRLAAVLLLCWPAIALADPNDTAEDALAAINQELTDLSMFADYIESALQEPPTVYVLGDPLSWSGVFVVPSVDVDRFVSYVQVNNLLKPNELDKSIALAANAVGLPKFVVDAILKDRAKVLAPGGAAAAAAEMKKLDAASRNAMKLGLKEIYKQVGALETAAASIESGATEWPPIIGGGGGKVNTFTPPLVDGMAMDACLRWGNDCWDVAANEFCRQKGFKNAHYSETVPIRPTRTLITKETCDADFCYGFTTITCQ